MRAPVAILVAVLVSGVTPAVAQTESPGIPPEQWKSLVKAVRIVRRDYVAPVDDARLASACADRVYAAPALKPRRPAQLVSTLTDVPVMLRSAAEAATDVAVYPVTAVEDQEVLIYRGFEWDVSKNQFESKSLYVVVNALGIVEDVRFSGSTNPIPPPAPGGTGVPIQIYTPPRTRSR